MNDPRIDENPEHEVFNDPAVDLRHSLLELLERHDLKDVLAHLVDLAGGRNLPKVKAYLEMAVRCRDFR